MIEKVTTQWPGGPTVSIPGRLVATVRPCRCGCGGEIRTLPELAHIKAYAHAHRRLGRMESAELVVGDGAPAATIDLLAYEWRELLGIDEARP